VLFYLLMNTALEAKGSTSVLIKTKGNEYLLTYIIIYLLIYLYTYLLITYSMEQSTS